LKIKKNQRGRERDRGKRKNRFIENRLERCYYDTEEEREKLTPNGRQKDKTKTHTHIEK
jgi:hypothetical protein